MKKIILAVALLASGSAFAEGDAQLLATQSSEWTLAFKYIGYFFAMAIASYGGTRAQSAAASTALEGMARNPAAADKLFVPMILALALMESLVIFVLITVFLI